MKWIAEYLHGLLFDYMSSMGFLVGITNFWNPPDPSEGISRAAESSERIGQQQVDLAKEQFDWNKQNMEEILPLIKSIYETQAQIMGDQNERAQGFYDYWEQNYKPIETQLAESVKDYNSENKRELMAQKAAGDIESTYSGMRGQLGRQLSRYGINPSSDRFATLNASLMRDEALQKAGAMTKARDAAEALGYARQLDVAGLGRGMVGAGQGAYSQAITAGNSAAQNAQIPMGMNNSTYGQMRSGLGAGADAFSSAGSLYGMDFNQRMSNFNANRAVAGDIMGFIGNSFGMMAEGGEVSGPGGPKDDRIPALLSDGEYVVPAAVVKRLGVKHFDSLIERHGDRDNKVALARRKGIKGRS